MIASPLVLIASLGCGDFAGVVEDHAKVPEPKSIIFVDVSMDPHVE